VCISCAGASAGVGGAREVSPSLRSKDSCWQWTGHPRHGRRVQGRHWLGQWQYHRESFTKQLAGWVVETAVLANHQLGGQHGACVGGGLVEMRVATMHMGTIAQK
jgi:hypothetical protein